MIQFDWALPKYKPFMIKIIFRLLSLFSTGLIGGAFFYGYLNVVPTFYDVKPAVHFLFRTALMKHNSILMPILNAVAIIFTTLFAFSIKINEGIARAFAFTASILSIITFLTTLFGNVPINGIIKTWSPDQPPYSWEIILRKWDFFNTIRTATAVGCFICILLTDFLRWYNSKTN